GLRGSSRPRRPGAFGAEGCVKGPGAASSRIYDALLAAPPFPCLRPPMPRISSDPRSRDTPSVRSYASDGLSGHDQVAYVKQKSFDHARDGRRDLGVHLVGVRLHQSLALSDMLASLLAPCSDG